MDVDATCQSKPDKKRALVIRSIPSAKNSIDLLEKHFSKFGTVVSIKVCYEGDPRSALVQFSSPLEATKAYRDTAPVCNNRFIKVFWMKGAENEKRSRRLSLPYTNEMEKGAQHKRIVPQRFSGVTVSKEMLQMVNDEHKVLSEKVFNHNLLIRRLEKATNPKDRAAIKKLLKLSVKDAGLHQGTIKSTARLIDTIYGCSQENTANKSEPQKMCTTVPPIIEDASSKLPTQILPGHCPPAPHPPNSTLKMPSPAEVVPLQGELIGNKFDRLKEERESDEE